jgi:hypothetical protein
MAKKTPLVVYSTSSRAAFRSATYYYTEVERDFEARFRRKAMRPTRYEIALRQSTMQRAKDTQDHLNDLAHRTPTCSDRYPWCMSYRRDAWTLRNGGKQ